MAALMQTRCASACRQEQARGDGGNRHGASSELTESAVGPQGLAALLQTRCACSMQTGAGSQGAWARVLTWGIVLPQGIHYGAHRVCCSLADLLCLQRASRCRLYRVQENAQLGKCCRWGGLKSRRLAQVIHRGRHLWCGPRATPRSPGRHGALPLTWPTHLIQLVAPCKLVCLQI